MLDLIPPWHLHRKEEGQYGLLSPGVVVAHVDSSVAHVHTVVGPGEGPVAHVAVGKEGYLPGIGVELGAHSTALERKLL